MRTLNHTFRLIPALFFSILILSACAPGPQDETYDDPYDTEVLEPEPFIASCDLADDMYMAEMYEPTSAEVEGDWLGQLSGPVTWTFNDGEVTRYDMLPGACPSGLECSNYIVSYGSYKLKNALLLLEWETQTNPNGSELPDLLYVQRGCNTGTVWIIEPNMTYGTINYASI